MQYSKEVIKKYKFRRYDKRFPDIYKREKIKLKKVIPNAIIEHIGSTAVPGLGGKGIIDILVAVNRKEINKIKNQLERANYVFKESGGESDRLFFKKNYKYHGKTRIVHLQLTHHDSYIFKRMIKFRDKLIKDKEYAKKYEGVKKEAVKIARGEGKIYRKHKKKIFKEIK
ncbi:MAG: GrpB family protein [bacterium]